MHHDHDHDYNHDVDTARAGGVVVGLEPCTAGLVPPWRLGDCMRVVGHRLSNMLLLTQRYVPRPRSHTRPSVRSGSSRPCQKTSSTIRCELWQQPCEQMTAQQTSGTQADLPGKQNGSVRDDRDCYRHPATSQGHPATSQEHTFLHLGQLTRPGVPLIS